MYFTFVTTRVGCSKHRTIGHSPFAIEVPPFDDKDGLSRNLNRFAVFWGEQYVPHNNLKVHLIDICNKVSKTSPKTRKKMIHFASDAFSLGRGVVLEEEMSKERGASSLLIQNT